jgi:hypothetical protein
MAAVTCTLSATGLIAIAQAPAFAAGAGTSIGNAAELVSSTTGGLTSTSEQDWWVIYPATTGGTVEIDISDTSGTTAGCQDVSFAIDSTNGSNQVLASDVLYGSTSENEYVSQPGSDRYYVELTTFDCSGVSEPDTYSLQVESGGGGTPPVTSGGTTGAGSSIGSVNAALLGATVYTGTIVSSSNQYWYQLYKPSAAGTATVRFEDTTVAGSTACADVGVEVTDADGNVLDNNVLYDNSAVTYSLTNAGLYYIAVYPFDCGGSDGASYSIEPEPGSAWGAAPTATVVSGDPGASIGSVHAALRGDTVYTGTIVTSSNQYWYQLYKPSASGTATVRFANTTVSGSTACADVGVEVTDADGNVLDNNVLYDNTAVTYSVANGGLYYVAIYPFDCSGTDGATYTIEPNTPSAWSAAPTAKAGTTKGAGTRAHATTPILGDTVYGGTIVSSSNQYWYRLYKPSGKGTATVRFADTTVNGTTACADVGVEVTDAHANVLDSTVLYDNTAVTFSVANAGLHYVEIYPFDCGGTDGATYSIEPNPASAWAAAPNVTSLSPARGSHRGGTLVKIHGSWLEGVTAVWFGTTKGSKVRVLSSTELTVIAPKHAKGTVYVTVTTGEGRSGAGSKTRYTFT